MSDPTYLIVAVPLVLLIGAVEHHWRKSKEAERKQQKEQEFAEFLAKERERKIKQAAEDAARMLPALNTIFNVSITLEGIPASADVDELVHGTADEPYKVNLYRLTCTCPNWRDTRAGFPDGDMRRMCKHLARQLVKFKVKMDPLIWKLVEESAKIGGVPQEIHFGESKAGVPYLFGMRASGLAYIVIAPIRNEVDHMRFDGPPKAFALERHQVRTGEWTQEDRWTWYSNRRPTGLTDEIRQEIERIENLRAKRQKILEDYPALANVR